jgi:hypothetical protein
MSDAALERMIVTLRALPGLAKDAAPEAARKAEAAIKATASAGTSPDGVAWAPTKKGQRAMPNAAGAVSTAVTSTVILIKLAGAEVFHHFGVRGAPARPIIPQGSMPAELGNAVRLGFVEIWKKLVR